MNNKPYKLLEEIQKQIGGDLRISRRCMPHLVLNHYYSICYFCKHDSFRIWKGYATPKNEKIADYKSKELVISTMRELLKGEK